MGIQIQQQKQEVKSYHENLKLTRKKRGYNKKHHHLYLWVSQHVLASLEPSNFTLLVHYFSVLNIATHIVHTKQMKYY